jgi:hypothetical protein
MKYSSSSRMLKKSANLEKAEVKVEAKVQSGSGPRSTSASTSTSTSTSTSVDLILSLVHSLRASHSIISEGQGERKWV